MPYHRLTQYISPVTSAFPVGGGARFNHNFIQESHWRSWVYLLSSDAICTYNLAIGEGSKGREARKGGSKEGEEEGRGRKGEKGKEKKGKRKSQLRNKKLL